MNLEINIEIKQADICLEEIIILSLLNDKKYKEIRYIHMNTRTNIIESIERLEYKGYVKIIDTLIDTEEGEFFPEAVSLRDKALTLVQNQSVDINELVDKFRELFPKGFTGDLSGCRTKLTAFMRKHRKYTPEIILKATENYNNFITRTNGYRRQAHYFIIKDGISDLGAYCERIIKGETISSTIEDNSIRL